MRRTLFYFLPLLGIRVGLQLHFSQILFSRLKGIPSGDVSLETVGLSRYFVLMSGNAHSKECSGRAGKLETIGRPNGKSTVTVTSKAHRSEAQGQWNEEGDWKSKLKNTRYRQKVIRSGWLCLCFCSLVSIAFVFTTPLIIVIICINIVIIVHIFVFCFPCLDITYKVDLALKIKLLFFLRRF